MPHSEQQKFLNESVAHVMALDAEDQARFMAAFKAAAQGEGVHERFTVSEKKIERSRQLLRTRTPRLTRTRSRERRSSRGRRRSSTTARDDGSDSDGSGDAGPPRRRFTVDDHYLVVGVVG